MKKTVAVVFGGESGEHSVSCVTGAWVADRLEECGYNVVRVGITVQGGWFLYSGGSEEMRSGAWELDGSRLFPAVISPSRGDGGLLVGGKPMRIDAVFPAVHGRYGEDGTLQGLLELSGIPFVGCGTFSSAVCMDKIAAKLICASAGIPVLPHREYRSGGFSPERAADECESAFGYPVFVKPARSGSSLGITRAVCREELISGFEAAFGVDDKLLAEPALASPREIETAILDCGELTVSECGEISSGSVFYDYDAKYVNGDSVCTVPAVLAPGLSDTLRAAAASAFTSLGCRGMARVDFFVCGDKWYFNEINTIPGLTPISMYPKLMEESGISGEQLVRLLTESACRDSR